ncbi:MAG: GNAT family N-acetyltransferase [Pirellulales bacterium]
MLACNRFPHHASAAERGCGLWMIRPRGGNDLIGFCALREIDGTAEVEIIYALAPCAWGNGFATEALRAVLAYGFEVIGLARI